MGRWTARRAGIRPAATGTAMMPAMAQPKIHGSLGFTPEQHRLHESRTSDR
jgi:hypothetical protein